MAYGKKVYLCGMKILFIHGLASSGAYKTADTLRILFRPCEVVAPDVPVDPVEALSMLRTLCETIQPDLVVGLSLGGFWAQKLRGYRKILINPDFHVSVLLRTMIGEQPWLSPRRDGAQTFSITSELCDRYETLEKKEFDELTDEERALTLGLFATDDEIVHCADEFESFYPCRLCRYPGKHLPTFLEIKKYMMPLVKIEGEGQISFTLSREGN